MSFLCSKITGSNTGKEQQQKKPENLSVFTMELKSRSTEREHENGLLERSHKILE